MDKKELVALVVAIAAEIASSGEVNEATARGLLGKTLEKNREALVRAAVPSFALEG